MFFVYMINDYCYFFRKTFIQTFYLILEGRYIKATETEKREESKICE